MFDPFKSGCFLKWAWFYLINLKALLKTFPKPLYVSVRSHPHAEPPFLWVEIL